MYPTMLGQLAQDHVRSLIGEADAVRLARSAAAAPSPRLRRRLGLRLISLGNKLATEPTCNVVPLHGGRV